MPDGSILPDDGRFSVAIRDPVWKHIWLTPELAAITTSADFLRLFRIRQLGPAALTYPGATHTRAGHSVGVYHLALKMLKQLLSRGADQWVTREGAMSFLCASLLHDLGHFPYTHSLKNLPLLDHEILTARRILSDPVRELVEKTGADPEMTAAIVDKSIPVSGYRMGETVFFRNILSGVLDPDKLDYLNRDAYYCGVPYGIQDIDFILSKIEPDIHRGITLESKAIMSVESLLFSKYLMYRSVYWHRQVRITTAMMKKTLQGGLECGEIRPDELYGLDDEGLHHLVDSRTFPAKEVATALRSGIYYRTLLEYPYRIGSQPRLETASEQALLESEISRWLSENHCPGIREQDVLVDLPERISFETDLMIHDEGRLFVDCPTVFSRTVIDQFVTSLRIVRIALHPRFFTIFSDENHVSADLADWLKVHYTE